MSSLCDSLDEGQASPDAIGANRAPASVASSSDAPAIALHATEPCAPITPTDRRAAALLGRGRLRGRLPRRPARALRYDADSRIRCRKQACGTAPRVLLRLVPGAVSGVAWADAMDHQAAAPGGPNFRPARYGVNFQAVLIVALSASPWPSDRSRDNTERRRNWDPYRCSARALRLRASAAVAPPSGEFGEAGRVQARWHARWWS